MSIFPEKVQQNYDLKDHSHNMTFATKNAHLSDKTLLKGCFINAVTRHKLFHQ